MTYAALWSIYVVVSVLYNINFDLTLTSAHVFYVHISPWWANIIFPSACFHSNQKLHEKCQTGFLIAL